MEKVREPIYKNLTFWLLVLGLVLVGLLFLLVIRLRQELLTGRVEPTTAATTQAQAMETERGTQPTLPPPEESPYDAFDFALDEKGYMTCLSGESSLGIDVSVYQKDIDWQKVKDAGIEFVIIKCGGRGYGQAGNLYQDSNWQKNYEGARAVGLQIGVYFFSQAITRDEAVEEAEYVLSLIEGKQIDLPIVYDWEPIDPATSDGIPRTIAMGRRGVTDCTKAFCDRILEADYEPMIYFNSDQSYEKMYLEELTAYHFWLACYTTQLNYPYKVDIWQYTQHGSVPGITGDVDINLYLHYD